MEESAETTPKSHMQVDREKMKQKGNMGKKQPMIEEGSEAQYAKWHQEIRKEKRDEDTWGRAGKSSPYNVFNNGWGIKDQKDESQMEDVANTDCQENGQAEEIRQEGMRS